MKKVFIGVGHGGKDSGAVGNGLFEKNMNLVTALAMRDYLIKYGVQVYISRTGDSTHSVSQRVKMCNDYKPDLALDIHYNAGGGDGFEAFVYSSNKGGMSCALAIEKRVKELGQNTRGIKNGDTKHFVKNTNATAILLEGGFIDNSKDVELFDENRELQNFGVAYAKGVLDYLGINYQEPAKPQPKPQPDKKYYRVQVGAYTELENAENMKKELTAKGYKCIIKYM